MRRFDHPRNPQELSYACVRTPVAAGVTARARAYPVGSLCRHRAHNDPGAKGTIACRQSESLTSSCRLSSSSRAGFIRWHTQDSSRLSSCATWVCLRPCSWHRECTIQASSRLMTWQDRRLACPARLCPHVQRGAPDACAVSGSRWSFEVVFCQRASFQSAGAKES